MSIRCGKSIQNQNQLLDIEYIDELIRKVLYYIFTCLKIIVSRCHSEGNVKGLRDSNLIRVCDFESNLEDDLEAVLECSFKEHGFEEPTTITVETNV